MTKFSPYLFSTAMFFVLNLTDASQLRTTDETAGTSVDERISLLIQRLDDYEQVQKQHGLTISFLEQSIEEHMQTIANLKQQNRMLSLNTTNATMCVLEYDDGYCKLDGDLKLTGRAHIMDGLDVSAGDCDNCIVFHDDVLFDDNVIFVDPVKFEDPVKFLEDVTIDGMEVPSSSKKSKKRKNDKIKSDDTTYTSLDFVVKDYAKIKFDQDKKFVVTSKARFENDVDIKLPSTSSSSKDGTPPDLFVEGNINAGGTITP